MSCGYALQIYENFTCLCWIFLVLMLFLGGAFKFTDTLITHIRSKVRIGFVSKAGDVQGSKSKQGRQEILAERKKDVKNTRSTCGVNDVSESSMTI